MQKLLLLLSLLAFLSCKAQDNKSKIAETLSKKEIKKGIKSHDKALFLLNDWIRDPYIILGPDDYYYLTGTTPAPNDPREKNDPYNNGLGKTSIVGPSVKLWRSKDLAVWEYRGVIFDHKDGVQYKSGKEKYKNMMDRVLWAPEVHWTGTTWALLHCPRHFSNLVLADSPELSPETEWSSPMIGGFVNKHDPSLFQDDDGTWYALWANTYIAELKDDFSAFVGEPVRIDPTGQRKNPRKNNDKEYGKGEYTSVIGHEGATMRKIGDKYVHIGTAWSTDLGRKGSYNLYYCVADDIRGPYSERRFIGRFLGHGTPFIDKDGQWWCTAFYNADVPPLPTDGIETRDLGESAQTINQRGTTIVPLDVKILEDGDIYMRAKDPHYANPGPDENQQF